jgi:hypothetical protein
MLLTCIILEDTIGCNGVFFVFASSFFLIIIVLFDIQFIRE